LCGGSAKTIPAAEQELPANLCPLIKSTYGYHVQRSNPFLEMADLVVAETTCDGKKKMYELMGRTRPMYVLEMPQKGDDADARQHWGAEVRKMKAELERRFGAAITDRKMREAIRLMNRERRLRRRLAELMKADRPVLTGRQLITLKSSISGIEADLEQYEAVASSRLPVASNDHDKSAPHDGDTLSLCCMGGGKSTPANTAGVAPGPHGSRYPKDCMAAHDAAMAPGVQAPCGCSEVTRGAAGGRLPEEPTPVPSDKPPVAPNDECGRVRVLMTGVPMAHGAERVLEIIEGCGGLVVTMESCTGVKPILEDVDEDAADPLEAIAEKYFHLPCSVMTPNDRRMQLLRDLAREYRADCVIDLVWQACLTYDVEARLVRRLVEEELGLPYLKIETDYSTSDSARIATRVEALLETVRGRQA
jgi:benzoyl-CoA reductase/2-hydroxyglutaryl-CoA dehydratase subunit BcrC/BadD/HgdB